MAEIAPTSRTPDPSTICLERLTEGEHVGGELICERKAIVTTASARVRFLAVGLRDDAGSIEARAFQNVDRLAAQFQPGDVVRVTGKVVVYRGELQLLLEEIECSGTEWPVPALARGRWISSRGSSSIWCASTWRTGATRRGSNPYLPTNACALDGARHHAASRDITPTEADYWSTRSR